MATAVSLKRLDNMQLSEPDYAAVTRDTGMPGGLPNYAYTSAEFFALEQEKLFAKTWTRIVQPLSAEHSLDHSQIYYLGDAADSSDFEAARAHRLEVWARMFNIVYVDLPKNKERHWSALKLSSPRDCLPVKSKSRLKPRVVMCRADDYRLCGKNRRRLHHRRLSQTGNERLFPWLDCRSRHALRTLLGACVTLAPFPGSLN